MYVFVVAMQSVSDYKIHRFKAQKADFSLLMGGCVCSNAVIHTRTYI